MQVETGSVIWNGIDVFVISFWNDPGADAENTSHARAVALGRVFQGNPERRNTPWAAFEKTASGWHLLDSHGKPTLRSI